MKVNPTLPLIPHIGLESVVPRDILYLFNERELALLISGAPHFDVDEWEQTTNCSESNNCVVQWFWKLVRSLSQVSIIMYDYY